MKKLAYHGTPLPERILAEGLRREMAPSNCKHIWLARSPRDAAAFGVVLEVDMTGIAGDFDEGAEGWQGCYHDGDLEPSRIRVYRF